MGVGKEDITFPQLTIINAMHSKLIKFKGEETNTQQIQQFKNKEVFTVWDNTNLEETSSTSPEQTTSESRTVQQETTFIGVIKR